MEIYQIDTMNGKLYYDYHDFNNVMKYTRSLNCRKQINFQLQNMFTCRLIRITLWTMLSLFESNATDSFFIIWIPFL
jgi:hypothetical protein